MKSIFKLVTMMLISTSLSAAEAGKVILLTSIQSPRILFHSDPYWAEDQAEKIFNQAFSQSGYRVETVRHASAWQLYQALHDPEAVGVFWLSHAAAPAQLNSVLSMGDAIVTYDGQDIKTLFQNIGSSVRFLAVIGCSDETTLTQYREKGYYAANPDLKIVSFADKVQPAPALTYSLNQSLDSLADLSKSDYGPDSRSPNGDPDWMHDSVPTIHARAFDPSTASPSNRGDILESDLIVERRVPSNAADSELSDLIFTSQGIFLGILPKPAPGDYQSLRIPAPTGRILVSARPGSKSSALAGLSIQSLYGEKTYCPLSVNGRVIGADSALFLPSNQSACGDLTSTGQRF